VPIRPEHFADEIEDLNRRVRDLEESLTHESIQSANQQMQDNDVLDERIAVLEAVAKALLATHPDIEEVEFLAGVLAGELQSRSDSVRELIDEARALRDDT
jgi:hypothetical protein